jgi:flagellar hook capping protein FlgD
VRPSKVTAELIGPDGAPRVLESDVAHAPGVYSPAFTGYDAEGAWHWHVQASDDLGRVSTADRAFRYDATLHGLVVPTSATGTLAVRFVLSRSANVVLRIETRGGIVMRELPSTSLTRGAQQLTWDGRLPQGTRAYGGAYTAHLVVTSDVGTSDFRIPFAFHR